MQSLKLNNSAIQENDNETHDGKNVEIAQTESCIILQSVDFFGYERKSIFYQFFIFIDNIIKLHYWRHSYYILQYLIPIFQLFALSFYPYLPNKWDSRPGEKGYSCCEFIHGFACIFTLSPPSVVSEIHIPTLIAISIISGLIIVITIACFLYYIFNSHSLPFFLPLLSFIVQIILFIFYFPTISALTSSFSGLIEQTPISIFAFAYLLIALIFLTAFIYFSTLLINFESNPNRSFFCTYTGKHIFHLYLIFGNCFILVSMTQYLPSWIIYFAIGLKIILTIALIVEVFSFPFVHFYSNVFSSSFYCMSIISDILLYFDGISPFVRLFLPFSVFILSFVIFSIVFNMIKKRILNILNFVNESQMSEIEKEQFLSEYVNPKTLLGGYQFLRLGFIFKSVQILKGKVSLYIAENLNSIDFWISLTSIISFFPGERDNFSICIKKLKSLFAKTFVEKQRILHLMMLEQHRYLTGTNEIPQRLSSLEMSTNNSIALTKQFWSEISKGDLKDPMKTLDLIAGEINDTKNMWIVNLHLFPNEYRFAALYSVFLIECLGKFEDGVIWLLKASHLERGFHSAVDELFKVFVCSLPYFLHDKIVNKYGFLLVEEKTFGETETVPDKMQQDKLEEDIENGMIEKLLSEKFVWPTLRNYLSRATSHYRPKYISIFTILKIISLLIIFVLLITINIVYSQEFTLFKYTYNIIESFNNVRVGLGFLYSSFLIQFTNYSIASTQLNLTNPSINLSNLTESMYEWIDYAEINYINFFYEISKDARSGEKISSLSGKLIEESIDRYFCFIDMNDNFLSKPFKTDMKSAITSSIISLQSLMFSNSSSIKNSSLFCEFNLLYPTLPDSFTNVSFNFSQLTHHINEDSQKTILIMLIVFLCFAVIFWIPLLIVPQLILQIESKRIVAAMKTVDQNAAFTASQPLTIEDENEPRQNYVFQNRRNSYLNMIWLWRFLYILMTLIIFVFVIVSYCVLHVSFNKLKNLILLDHYGSTRHGLCTEIFSLTIYKIISISMGIEYFNSSLVTNYFLRYVDQITECSNVFIHGNENLNGMSSYSKSIERLHIEDKCEASYGDLNYYECMSFQRAISSFIVLAKETMTDNFGTALESRKFYELFHVLTSDVNVMNEQSRDLTKDIIKGTIKKSLTVSIVLLSIAAVFDIILFVCDFVYVNKLTLRMNTALLLIRHLPPPSVVETKGILDILLVENEDRKDQSETSVNDVIFNTITSPTILIGEGNIIEKVNSSFQDTFGLSSEKVVGRNLNFFIPPSDEDEGSLRLYDMLLKIQEGVVSDEPFSLVTKCVTSEEDEKDKDVMVTVKVTVFAVHDKDDFVNGFVILVDDKSRTANVEHQLSDVKKEVEQLISQLIPLNFNTIFRNEGNDFGYVIPSTFVVVVHVSGIEEFLEKNWNGYGEIISSLENEVKKNPPFIFLQTVYDVISFISGIIVDKEMGELASISHDFGRALVRVLNKKLPRNKGKRFTVSIASGGPLIAGFFNSIDASSCRVSNNNSSSISIQKFQSHTNFSSYNSTMNGFASSNNNGTAPLSDDSLISDLDTIPVFDVLGNLLVKAAKLAVNADSEDIIVSSDTRELLGNDKSIIFGDGPVIDGEKTYLIPSNIV